MSDAATLIRKKPSHRRYLFTDASRVGAKGGMAGALVTGDGELISTVGFFDKIRSDKKIVDLEARAVSLAYKYFDSVGMTPDAIVTDCQDAVPMLRPFLEEHDLTLFRIKGAENDLADKLAGRARERESDRMEILSADDVAQLFPEKKRARVFPDGPGGFSHRIFVGTHGSHMSVLVFDLDAKLYVRGFSVSTFGVNTTIAFYENIRKIVYVLCKCGYCNFQICVPMSIDKAMQSRLFGSEKAFHSVAIEKSVVDLLEYLHVKTTRDSVRVGFQSVHKAQTQAAFFDACLPFYMSQAQILGVAPSIAPPAVIMSAAHAETARYQGLFPVIYRHLHAGASFAELFFPEVALEGIHALRRDAEAYVVSLLDDAARVLRDISAHVTSQTLLIQPLLDRCEAARSELSAAIAELPTLEPMSGNHAYVMLVAFRNKKRDIIAKAYILHLCMEELLREAVPDLIAVIVSATLEPAMAKGLAAIEGDECHG